MLHPIVMALLGTLSHLFEHPEPRLEGPTSLRTYRKYCQALTRLCAAGTFTWFATGVGAAIVVFGGQNGFSRTSHRDLRNALDWHFFYFY
jgi:hypothetical protein